MVSLETIQQLNLPQRRFVATSASFVKRSGAFIIDLLIMDILFFSAFKKYLILPEMSIKEAIMQSSTGLPTPFLISIIMMGTIALLYFSLTEYYLGYTLGKHILGLRVIGKKGFFYFLIRNAFAIPVFPFTVFWFVEPFMIIRKKQGFLEQISGTATIELTALN